jgi:predicted transcriptional regulator
MSKKPIFVSPNDVISKSLSKMKMNRVHQLLVMENGEFHGMILLKDLVMKDVDAKRTKITNYIIKTPLVYVNESPKKVIEMLINLGLRALPVQSKGKIAGVISETDLLRLVKDDKEVYNIMTEAICASDTDDIGKIRTLMTKKNISRIPILKDGKLIGVIGYLELIKVAEAKQSFIGKGPKAKLRGAKEYLPVEKIQARTILKPIEQTAVVSKDTPVREVAQKLINNEEVLVRDEDKVFIVTPKDILELIIPRPKHEVYLNITGIDDDYVKERLLEASRRLLTKLGSIDKGINYLIIHTERYKKTGFKTLYSMRTRLSTKFGLFISKSRGWEPLTVAQKALHKLEKSFKKKNQKILERRKKRRKSHAV